MIETLRLIEELREYQSYYRAEYLNRQDSRFIKNKEFVEKTKRYKLIYEKLDSYIKDLEENIYKDY